MYPIDEKTGLVTMNGYLKFPNKLFYSHDLLMRSSKSVPILNRHKIFNYFNVANDNYLVTLAIIDIGLIRGAFINA